MRIVKKQPVLCQGISSAAHFLFACPAISRVLKDMNKRQSTLANNRLAQFVKLLYGWMNNGQLQGVSIRMLQGFPVYFMTTSLMCSYGEILMPEELGLRTKMEQTLYSCYGELSEYHVITPTLSLKNGYSLRLRMRFPIR